MLPFYCAFDSIVMDVLQRYGCIIMLNKNAILLQHFLSAPVKLYMYVRILLCSKFIVEKSGTS